MARSAGYYDVDDFNNYKRKQGKLLPPRANLVAAACHIQRLFDAKKFTYGFIGGLPMLCLGYKREMPDLHIAYDDKDFERLKAKLESDHRVRLPIGMNPLLPFKMLVWTGPEYKDQDCTISASIELDLVPSGSCGTPAAGGLTKSLVSMGLKTASGKQLIFKCLNIQYLVITLLSYCKARDLLWDPRKDILYLCKNETEEVQRNRAGLNKKEVKELFLGTSFFSRLHIEDQRLCYRVLLDTKPPPTMAITPPAPQTLAYIQAAEREPARSCDARSPRSRYRNVNRPNIGGSGTSDHQATKDVRPQLMEHLQDSRRLSHIQGVHCANFAKPQSVSAAITAKRARKSMPDLMAAHYAAPTPHAGSQEAKNTTTQQQHHERFYVSHVPSQLPSISPHHTYVSSRLAYGGGFQPAHIIPASGTENSSVAFTLGQMNMTDREDSTKSDSEGTSVQGIQSQKGSLHVVSPEGEDIHRQQYFEDKSALPRGRPHLFGPEGVYDPLVNPQETRQPQARHQRHQSAPPPQKQPAFVFELDATAQSKAAFTAELPADPIVLSPAEKCNIPYHDAPHFRATTGPSNLRTPLENGSLPASLVAGRSGTQAHRQSFGHTEPSDGPNFGFSTRQTNAYRYSSYASPQSINRKALDVSSDEATTPVYKAYRPFITTKELNRTDSVSSVYSPGHKRNESDNSTVSHDSSKLAIEYQELLNFEEGYGSG